MGTYLSRKSRLLFDKLIVQRIIILMRGERIINLANKMNERVMVLFMSRLIYI